MSARRLLAAGILLGISVPPVLGQDGIGSNPAQPSADRTEYITKSGKTVPKPNTLNPSEGTDIQRRTPEQVRDDAITRGICIGCSR